MWEISIILGFGLVCTRLANTFPLIKKPTHLKMLVFNIILPEQFYICHPEAFVHVFNPRLDQDHIDEVYEIGQIVKSHPYRPVVYRLIWKSASQWDNPGVVQNRHGGHGHPRHIDLPVGVDYFLLQETREQGASLRFDLGHFLDILVGERDAQFGLQRNRGGLDGFPTAYRRRRRRGFDSFSGGLRPGGEGVH